MGTAFHERQNTAWLKQTKLGIAATSGRWRAAGARPPRTPRSASRTGRDPIAHAPTVTSRGRRPRSKAEQSAERRDRRGAGRRRPFCATGYRPLCRRVDVATTAHRWLPHPSAPPPAYQLTHNRRQVICWRTTISI